ncbi:glutaredoxin family protein [Arthrobacter nitrophenolicus]|uniref:Glutaredoxin family protein n=1 Tax=Arthrobacter nitrophenolicus TaxID=683150 RepID=A0A4V3B1K0_9MICC|nr:glutaredoxin family protein [Arthrobacter nitrophenolicus]TDL37228.1 glutaredoxin family protein [Arthrobacter nitrophenolicus]
MTIPRVVLLTKANCHLCEDARDAVARVTASLGLEWTEEPVDEQPELRERYAEEIPVVLVDGVQRDFWKINEAHLERVLQRAMAQ